MAWFDVKYLQCQKIYFHPMFHFSPRSCIDESRVWPGHPVHAGSQLTSHTVAEPGLNPVPICFDNSRWRPSVFGQAVYNLEVGVDQRASNHKPVSPHHTIHKGKNSFSLLQRTNHLHVHSCLGFVWFKWSLTHPVVFLMFFTCYFMQQMLIINYEHFLGKISNTIE